MSKPLVVSIPHRLGREEARRRLKAGLARIPNVLPVPKPDVEILEFSLAGPVLAVRPYCKPADYWQVYFDTNRLIRETFGEAGFPAPEQHYAVRNPAPAASA